MSTARYVFAVLLVISFPPSIGYWFVIHPFVGFWRKVGKPITYTVMFLLFVGGGVGLFAIRDKLLLTDLGTNWILVGVAAALSVPALFVSILRAKYLTVDIQLGAPELDADGSGGELLNEGIYAFIRNPRYVEMVLGGLALAAFANYVGAYIVALLFIPCIHAVVLIEEKELAKRFGEEYEAYRASVPRYIPRRGA